MTVRFQADADLHLAILLGVTRREPSVDFRTAVSAELEGLQDTDVLSLAAASGRVLVTHDRRTMPSHFADFLGLGRRSPGVLIVPQSLPIAIAVEEILLIWGATEAEEWIDRILSLPL